MSSPDTLQVSDYLRLERLNADHIFDIFSLIDENRAHLSQFGDTTAQKYPTIQSLYESIRYPANPLRERYAIIAGETVVGSINAEPIEKNPAYLLGYWLGSTHLGRGYASQAAQGLSDNLLDRANTEYVDAHTHPDNRASQFVLVRAGFICISQTVENVIFRKTKQQN